MLELFDITY